MSWIIEDHSVPQERECAARNCGLARFTPGSHGVLHTRRVEVRLTSRLCGLLYRVVHGTVVQWLRYLAGGQRQEFESQLESKLGNLSSNN